MTEHCKACGVIVDEWELNEIGECKDCEREMMEQTEEVSDDYSETW